MLWEHWLNRFIWGVTHKRFNLTSFYTDKGLTAAQIKGLSVEVLGKNRLEADQSLDSNLYLCLGERGQHELHNWETPLGASGMEVALLCTNYYRGNGG